MKTSSLQRTTRESQNNSEISRGNLGKKEKFEQFFFLHTFNFEIHYSQSVSDHFIPWKPHRGVEQRCWWNCRKLVDICWWVYWDVFFCRHFMQADSKKFEDVWCMNEAECKELVTTLVEADRAIHEQQLGIQYQNPDL